MGKWVGVYCRSLKAVKGVRQRNNLTQCLFVQDYSGCCGKHNRKKESVAVSWHLSLVSDNISGYFVHSLHLTLLQGFLSVLFSSQCRFSLFMHYRLKIPPSVIVLIHTDRIMLSKSKSPRQTTSWLLSYTFASHLGIFI